MSIFTKYLVCYDIDSDRTRSRFFDALKDLGLVPLQKSVFYGELNPAELRELWKMSRKMLDEDTDKCFWIPCSIKTEAMRQFIGYKNFRYIASDGFLTV